MRIFLRYGAMLLIVLFLLFFLILPTFTVLRAGCDPQLIAEVFAGRIYREGLINSFCIAAVTTSLVFLISLPLAMMYCKYDFPLKNYSNLLMMIPMVLPPFVGAIGFQQILGHYGILNAMLTRIGLSPVDFLGGPGKFWSICIIEALHLFPILYLNLVAAISNIDPAALEAAKNMGAGRVRRFFKITLPLMKPGILAGGSIVLVWSFTELGTPLMFGYNRVTPVQIFNGITELESNPVPFALVVIMLVISVLLYVFGKWSLSGSVVNANVKGNNSAVALPLTGKRKWIPAAAFCLVGFLAGLPHIALILSSFSKRFYNTVWPEGFTLINFENALSNKIVVPSIINSLHYSLLAMLIAIAVGVFIALANIRWKLKGGFLLDVLAMLPLAIPGIVIAFGFLGMAVHFTWAAKYFNPVENPLLLLAVAYAVRRLPYVVRSVSAGLEQTSEELEFAARNLGANTWTVLKKVTLPLIMANVIVGGLFAFSFSMLEVSDSLILAQKAEFYPITKAIFELSQILGSGPATASAFGVWAGLFLAATLAAAGIFLGKQIGNIFKL